MFPKDVDIIEPHTFSDLRGSLDVVFETDGASDIAVKRSFSYRSVFRGMHFQPNPFGQVKIIEVLQGRIVDFLIDMDPKSASFGRTYAVPLAASDNKRFRIPAHYAHGFLALSDCIFQYITIGKYVPSAEVTLSLPESFLNNLELGIFDNEIILSEKDKSATMYEDYFTRQ